MGNHLHLKVKFKDKVRFQNFTRTFAAILSRKILGSRQGKSFGKFWDGIVFSRVVFAKIEEFRLKGYFEGNHRERELGRQVSEMYLKNFNLFIRRLKQTRVNSASSIYKKSSSFTTF